MHLTHLHRLCAVCVALVLVVGIIGCHSGTERNVAPTAIAPATAVVSQSGLLGDLNGSETPDVADAIGILRIVVGLDAHNPLADCDGDGNVGVADAIMLLRCVVGLDDWPIGGGAAPTVTLTATPAEIAEGESTTLTWSATNATAVVESNFGADTVSGSLSQAPESGTVFSITVSGPGGEATATVGVAVSVAPLTGIEVERGVGEVALPAECPTPLSEAVAVTSFTPDAPVSADGAFTVRCSETLAQAVTLLGPEDQLLGFAINPGSTAVPVQLAAESGGLRIDATTTAVSLVFMHPFIARSDPVGAGRLLEFLATLPEIDVLAAAIEQSLATGADISDEGNTAVQSALAAATDAALTALLAELDEVDTGGFRITPDYPTHALSLALRPSSTTTRADVNVANLAMRYMALYAIPENNQGVPQNSRRVGPIMVPRADSLDSSLFKWRFAAPSDKLVNLDFSSAPSYTLKFVGPGWGMGGHTADAAPALVTTTVALLLVPVLEVATGLPFSLIESFIVDVVYQLSDWVAYQQAVGRQDVWQMARLLPKIAWEVVKDERVIRALATRMGWSVSRTLLKAFASVTRVITIVNAGVDLVRSFWEMLLFRYNAVVIYRVYATADVPVIITGASVLAPSRAVYAGGGG